MDLTPAPLAQRLLAQRAAHLSRQVHRSLSRGYRLAGLLTVLAGDSLDTFGRVIVAEMILAVVRGMPEVGGKPASDWIQDVHLRGADVLPLGAGRPFAVRVYKILLTRFGAPDVVQDAMSSVLLQVARKKIHIRNGASLHDAESYVITTALNAARDLLRARARRREKSLVRENDDDGVTVDVEDPTSFRALDETVTPAQMQKLLRDLAVVHPRAPDYVRALLDGDSAGEIAEEWRVTPSYVSKFKRLFGPEIRRFVEDRFRAASASGAYSYDRRCRGA